MPLQRLKFFARDGDEKVVALLLCLFLPIHEVYCEIFSGSSVRLSALANSRREILVGLERRVVYFFRVLCNLEYVQATYILTLKGGYSYGSFA